MTSPPENGKQRLSDQTGSESPAFLELQRETDAIAADYNRTMAWHAQVEHLAGLSEDAIAQELINTFGPERVLNAIATVRRQGKQYFLDVLFTLIPDHAERSKFYEQILSANDPGTSGQKRLYVRFCQRCDTILGRIHISTLLGSLRNLFLRSRRSHLERKEYRNLLAHHHFQSLPRDFDPSMHLPTLQESGNQLVRLKEIADRRQQQTLIEIAARSEALRTRIRAVMDPIRIMTEAQWEEEIAALGADLERTKATADTMTAPEAKTIFQNTIATMAMILSRTKAACESALKENTAPYTDLLRRLPNLKIPAQPAPSDPSNHDTNGAPRSNGNGNGNGKPRKNGKPKPANGNGAQHNGTGNHNHSPASTPQEA